MSKGIRETNQFVLFWGGWPSQWHKARFVVDGVPFNCCEQYMMAEKAAVFGDAEAHARILAASDPKKQKAIGRTVRGFDAEVWDSVCRGIVYTGNLARFEQDAGMRAALLATGDKTIVEASPTDRIWGIGLAQDDERALDPGQWRGTNWLGVALMQVRETLRGSPAEYSDEELARQLMLHIECRSKRGEVAAVHNRPTPESQEP
jgi:ribA/ribD-fused uncharacterized protein